MAQLAKLVFPTTSAIKSKYQIVSDSFGCALFDTLSNDFIIRPPLDGYQKRYDGNVLAIDGYTSPVINTQARRITVDVTLPDGREEIRYILEALMHDANLVPGTFAGITMYDYVSPEEADYATGYTVRTGFVVPEPLGGSMSSTDQGDTTYRRYGKGTKFSFTELTRRAW